MSLMSMPRKSSRPPTRFIGPLSRLVLVKMFSWCGTVSTTNLPLSLTWAKALVVVGAKDETTPPRLAESLRDALSGAGVQPENLRFELLPTAAHLPMEQTEGGVRETFEALVVEQVKALK